MQNPFRKIHIDYNSSKRIPALDGLRGLAMIAVLLYHYFRIYAGWVALDSFFVLSGFLITGILLDTKQSKHYYKNYIARRILRILPLYYGVLIVFFIIIPLFVNKSALAPFAAYYHDQAYFWTYLQNWIIMFRNPEFRGADRLFVHLWSLALEEQFYIIWPLVVLIFNTRKLVIATLILICISIALKFYYFFGGYAWEYTYFNTFTRLDALCIGSLVAVFIRNKTMVNRLEKVVPYIFKILFVVLLSAILLIRPRMPKDPFLDPIGSTLFAVFFASWIIYSLSSHKNNMLKRTMESKILGFFGKYSYSMYIFHVPIICLLRPTFYAFFEKHFANKLLPNIFGNLLCLVLTILISQVTWILIEQPALKLKKFFSYKTDKKPVIRHEPVT